MLKKNNAKFFFVSALTLALSATVHGVPPASVNTGQSSPPTTFAPNKILVKFQPGMTALDIANSHGAINIQSQTNFSSVDGLKAFTLPPGQNLATAIAHYQKNPNVVYVEPDYELSFTAAPNDTSFGNLWGLDNTGQTVNGTASTTDADMNILEAWNNSGVTGSNSVVVAVIDSGVQYDHPDLAANMWTNPGEIPGNGIDDDGNGYIDDVYGINAITHSGNPMDDNMHGTHVAGTIAGVGNNSAGMTGVVQQAKILACKFLSSTGSGATSDAIKCLDYIYALKQKGINIIVSNNSWGGTGGSQALADAIDAQRRAGILFVAAAGNDGVDNDATPHYPANYFKANVISVAATTQTDTLAAFSDYGLRSVHVGAPGVNIYSTVPTSSYAYLQGTSMATPNVTGLVALLAAQDATRNWKTLKNLVIASGTPIAALNGKTVSGRRVRAWDSNGTGAMTCSNQSVASVVFPQVTGVTKIAGTQLGLAAMNINCATPAGTMTVSTSAGAVATLTLQDDGLGFDDVAGDGIYSGYWTAPVAAGTYTLTFSNAQTLTVVVNANTSTLTPYRAPIATTYNPRTSASTFSTMPDNGYGGINGWTTYYNINFGGVAMNTLYFTPKGVALLNAPSAAQLTGGNTLLPNDAFETLVAAYWDDLDLTAAGNGLRSWWWYNSGTTPVGELVVEWKGVQKTSGVPVQVQLVFTANSSDVEMHYIATDSSGATATTGIQVDWVRGTTQSFDTATADLTAGKAWRWKLDTGAPTANAGIAQNVNGNALVTLSGSGTDLDSGTLKYSWSQTAGTAATLSNANVASPTFYAPNVTGTLTFQLTVTDDANRAATATVNINVTAVAGAGTLQFNAATYAVNENSGTATITVDRVGGSTGAVGLTYATSDGTATAGADYTYTSGTLSWANGDITNKTISIPIIDDIVIEGNENLSILLSNATGGATLGSTSATLTINDNDSAGVISFSATVYSVLENVASVTITATRTGGVSGAVSANYATANGTATSGSDYTATSGTLAWTAGDSANKTFSITILDDSVYEGNETVTLSLSGATGGATLGSNATLTITENDAAPAAGTIAFSAASYTVTENGASAIITATRTGGGGGAVGVSYATSNGTATAGSDYTTATGTLSWADGDSANKTFSITILDDSIFEGNETASISLSNVVGGATLGTSSATLTIIDNESAPASASSIAFSATAYSAAENGGSATITATRTGGSSGAASVSYATSNGTATANSDYTAASGTLNWADGDSANKTFTVTILDDTVYEGDETVSLALSNVTGASLATSSATLTIVENDAVNHAPDVVDLISPTDGALSVDGTNVTFKFNKVTDVDGDTVSYNLYYCTNAAFTGCTPTVVTKADIHMTLMAGLGGGTGIVLLGLVGAVTRRQRLVLIAVAMGIMFMSTGCGGNLPPGLGGTPTNTASKQVSGLVAGTQYYWKVVADDGRGMSSTSAVWSFTTK
ncbi:MAG: Calx-beta domain-containing protein [Pseudomonadota bacterium]